MSDRGFNHDTKTTYFPPVFNQRLFTKRVNRSRETSTHTNTNTHTVDNNHIVHAVAHAAHKTMYGFISIPIVNYSDQIILIYPYILIPY